MTPENLWMFFIETGDIYYYMLYKEAKCSDDK